MAGQTSSASLRRGDLLPRVLTSPPGPRARRLCRELATYEAPGINTLVSGRPAPLWREARGANVLDVDGNRYIDLTAAFGVAAVGHRHPRVVAAVRDQVGRLTTGLADVHAHPARVRLAGRLSALAPLDDACVYFAVSGSDAVEVALKTVLLATGRDGVLAFEPAYHGLTLGSLSPTSRQEFRQPFASRLHRRLVRLPFACDPQEVAKALARAGDIGCVILEPVVGREGVLVPPPGWLLAIARICRRHRTLLVADEIFTGFGRTGSWFAVDQEGVAPDILCCGKALGGGLPIAAVVASRDLMSCWPAGGEALHTGTFVAHPLSCAAALAVLDVLDEEELPARAARLGARIAELGASWSAGFPTIRAVRGRGLLWGVEMHRREDAARLCRRLLRRGLLILAGGPAGNVVQLVPPLVISRRQLEHALGMIEEELSRISPR